MYLIKHHKSYLQLNSLIIPQFWRFSFNKMHSVITYSSGTSSGKIVHNFFKYFLCSYISVIYIYNIIYLWPNDCFLAKCKIFSKFLGSISSENKCIYCQFQFSTFMYIYYLHSYIRYLYSIFICFLTNMPYNCKILLTYALLNSFQFQRKQLEISSGL